MKLISIDKDIYRHRLNRVIVSFIVVFALLAVGFGTILIELFTQVPNGVVVNDTSSYENSNFKFNLVGVIIALLVCAAILHKLKTTDYFQEIYYVWQLKQIQNHIFRKLKTIKKQAYDNNNHEALIILSFYYQSLKLVYELDDNTLTISSVKKEIGQLNEFLEKRNITIENEDFDRTMVASF